jgi:nitrogen fixation protein NifU and related proteins
MTDNPQPIPRSASQEQQVQPLSAQVLDHLRHPRNPGRMDHADGYGSVTGSCGDTIDIFVQVQANRVVRASFECRGCAFTVACASVASELIAGETLPHARRAVSPDAIIDALGGLPDDHLHCASLATHSVHEALDDAIQMAREPWRKAFRR